MDYNKAVTITQIILIVLMIVGGIFFYKMIKEREEIFQHVLDYVITEYQLESCMCLAQDGSHFAFDKDKVRITRSVGSGSGIQDYNISEVLNELRQP